MKRLCTYIILYASIACTSGADAQDTLSIEQCREMALTYNKEMAASAHATQSAVYTAKSYKGNFLPNIYVSGTGLYSTANGSSTLSGGYLPTFLPDATGTLAADGGYAYFPGMSIDYDIDAVLVGSIVVEQPIYMGGKISAAYKMARIGQDIAREQETLTATEVIRNTDEAYAAVVKAGEMCKVATTYRGLLTELMKTVESAYKHGMKPKNDVLKVQVRLNESELALRKAENALRLATMNLCHCIGRPLNDEISVSAELPAVLMPTDNELNSLDVSRRPEYAILEKQVDIAHQQVKLNRSELLPQIGLSASYNYLHGIDVNDNTLLDNGNFTALLNVSVPLFHFGERKNKVNAAKSKLLETQMEQQDMNEKMLLELAQAANNLDEAALELNIAVRSLEQAEENMRVSRSQYDAGMETLSDHLEAQTLWQQAYERRVDAAYQLYLAYVAYQKAAGTLYSDD